VNMVDVDRAVIARLKKQENVFEILVDCDRALEYRAGKNVSLDDVVAVDHIFKDVKKGERASDNVLKSVFGTEDPTEIAKTIIKEGEIQLTAAHREKIREEKRRRIVEIIHRNAIDSKTGLPHPPQRIENAMNEAKVHIDENKGAEEQIDDILKKIRVIIPIKFEVRELAVKIPNKYAGQSYGILKRYKLLRDEWQNDGSLVAIVEIPAGIQDEFMGQLNKITHGDVEIKILKAD